MAGKKGEALEKAASESGFRERFRGLAEIWGEVWHQNMGKAAVALIVFFVLGSIYALVTIPLSFANQWQNLQAWQYYPDTVPPAWVSSFGIPVAPQLMKNVTEPASVRIYVASRNPYNLTGVRLFGVAASYTVEYNLKAKAFPQGLLVVIGNVVNETLRTVNGLLTPQNVTVTVYVLLHRPDGKVLLVNNPVPVSLAQLFPGTVVRFSNSMVAQEYMSMLQSSGLNLTKYNITVDYLQPNAVRLAFGKLVISGNSKKIVPLTGTYTVEVIVDYLARDVDPRLLYREISAGNLGVTSLMVDVKGSAYGLMGTDNYGRDIFKALLFAFPIELLIGFVAAVASAMIGMVLGVISGYYGGWVDEFIQRLIDVIGNIPWLPILVLIGAALQSTGHSGWVMLFAIVGVLIVFGWGGLALIVRSMVLSIKSEPYIDSAKAIGASDKRIIMKHVLPQVLPYVMANLVFSVPGAIITEAGLSVLGIRHNLPTWGMLLASARDYIGTGGRYDIWWWILPPGILMGLMSVAFVFLGLALETVVEPRLRRR